MKDFLKQLLTSTLAYIIGSVLVLVLVFAVVASRINSQTERDIDVRDNSVLVLRLEGSLQERGNADPFAALMGDEGGMNLRRMVQAVKAATTDDRIKGIYLDVRVMEAGYASAEALRNALKEFKASGKFILAHGEIFTEKTLYIASVADSVLLYPQGMVEWNGLVSNQMFLRGMLDRWGVEPVLIRVGTFKSAAENITERQMSPANREQIGTMLNDMWNHILNGIAEARGRSAAELDSAASRFTVVTAQDAINVGLVDGVRFDDQIRATLRAKLGLGAEDDIRTIGYADYAEAQAQNAKFHENKIAVIYAVGEINYGAGDANTIGNLTLCRQIREAAEDDKVKAIVLRVNSPGGSALASDMIWREILQAKAKKPVIASMGDVAASGGYYISAPCDRILAEPTTITGSIGVIGLLMNTQKFFTNELGITFDRVYSNDNRYADLGNPNRPMSDYERERIQLGVNQIYRDFLTVVANGRGFANADSVDRIAQGRVWSGLRALELKLVDELGGLDRAIAIAAERANVQEYRVVEIPRQREGLEAFFEGMKERRERDNELDAQATANGAANPAAAAERHLAQRYLPAQARTALNLLRVFTADPRGLYYHTGISVSID